MGYHMALVLAEGASVEELATAVGVHDPHVVVTGDEATSQGGNDSAWVARIGDWAVLSDPTMAHIFETDHWEQLSKGRRILTILFMSVSTTYGFTWFVDGVATRNVVYVDYAPVESATSGVPLAEESEPAAGDPPDEEILLGDEDWAFRILENLTGVTGGALLHADFSRVG